MKKLFIILCCSILALTGCATRDPVKVGCTYREPVEWDAVVTLSAKLANADYIVDVQFTRDENDVISVPIDSEGNGYKDFDEYLEIPIKEYNEDTGEVRTNGIERQGIGTMVAVTNFVEKGGLVQFGLTAERLSVISWVKGWPELKVRSFGHPEKAPLKLGSWMTSTIPPDDMFRMRARRPYSLEARSIIKDLGLKPECLVVERSGAIETVVIKPPPMMSDGFTHTIAIDHEKRQYWVHRTGGIAGISEKHGPMKMPDVSKESVATGKVIIVLGCVNRPGKYPWVKDMTILDAIGNAGGLTGESAPEKTAVARDGRALWIDLSEMAMGKVQPFILQVSDVIVVHPRNFTGSGDYWTPEEKKEWERRTGEVFPLK